MLDHPDVDDVCVVGIPDEFSGEVPLSFVVLKKHVEKRISEDAASREDLKRLLMKVCI